MSACGGAPHPVRAYLALTTWLCRQRPGHSEQKEVTQLLQKDSHTRIHLGKNPIEFTVVQNR